MRTGRKSYVAVDDLGNFTHSPVTTLEVGRELALTLVCVRITLSPTPNGLHSYDCALSTTTVCMGKPNRGSYESHEKILKLLYAAMH